SASADTDAGSPAITRATMSRRVRSARARKSWSSSSSGIEECATIWLYVTGDPSAAQAPPSARSLRANAREVVRGDLPLDVAADARHLRLGHWSAGQHGIERRAEVRAGHGKAVLRPRRIELAAIREQQVAIEHEEVRRAGRAVCLRHRLRCV